MNIDMSLVRALCETMNSSCWAEERSESHLRDANQWSLRRKQIQFQQGRSQKSHKRNTSLVGSPSGTGSVPQRPIQCLYSPISVNLSNTRGKEDA